MNLEVNLIKVPSVAGKMGTFLGRNRYSCNNDTEALDAINKFISENMDTITAVIIDPKLNGILTEGNLTINDLMCIKYLLSLKGLDLWYWYVSDSETNATGIEPDTFEYNVVDELNLYNSSFIPFCTKVNQLISDMKISAVYSKIIDIYGLFQGTKFNGIHNPLKNTIDSMKGSETALGTVPGTLTTYTNSVLEYLGKNIKVITD